LVTARELFSGSEKESPINPYHVSAVAPGFESAEQDVYVRSPIALDLKFSLKIGTSTESVTVAAAADLGPVNTMSFSDKLGFNDGRISYFAPCAASSYARKPAK
jgi:hypothetical protein